MYEDTSSFLPSPPLPLPPPPSCRSQTPTESNSGKEKSEVTVSEGDISEDLDSTLVAEEVEERSTSSGTVEEGTEARTPIVASPVKSRKRLPLSKITPTSQGRVVPDAEQEPDEVGDNQLSHLFVVPVYICW